MLSASICQWSSAKQPGGKRYSTAPSSLRTTKWSARSGTGSGAAAARGRTRRAPCGPAAGWRGPSARGVRWATASVGAHAVTPRVGSGSPVVVRNRSRVQKLKQRPLLRFGDLAGDVEADGRVERVHRGVARRPAPPRRAARRGSAKSRPCTVVITARVKPCTGRARSARSRKCIPMSPGSALVAGRPVDVGRDRSAPARKAGTPSCRPRKRVVVRVGGDAARTRRSTSAGSASCIIQNAAFGWVTQPCSSAASAAGPGGGA